MSNDKKLTTIITNIIKNPTLFINQKINRGYQFLQDRLNEAKMMGVLMILGSILSLLFCSSSQILRSQMNTQPQDFETITKLLDQKIQKNRIRNKKNIPAIRLINNKTVNLSNESLPQKKIDPPIAISMHIRTGKALQTRKIKDLKIIFSLSWKPIRDLTQYPILGKGNKYIDTSIVMDSSRITKLLPQQYGLSLNSFEAPFMELSPDQQDLATNRRRVNIAYLERTESAESQSSVPAPPARLASNLWNNSLAAFEENRNNNSTQRSDSINREVEIEARNTQSPTASQRTRKIVRWLFSKFIKTTYPRFNLLNTFFIKISD